MCINDSECNGACGKSPLAGGIPRIPQIAVVQPNKAISQAYPVGFFVPYRGSVQIIELISWSKKNNTVIIMPGTMAANTHVTSSSQNLTKNVDREGREGRKELDTASLAFSREASSPMLGKAMKRMMLMAAAYSERKRRM